MKKRKRIYLSGPMSGIPKYNRSQFCLTASQLRAKGHEVINPAELHTDMNWSWHEYLLADLAHIASNPPDEIHMLPGWENSYGARIEKLFCEKLNVKAVII